MMSGENLKTRMQYKYIKTNGAGIQAESDM